MLGYINDRHIFDLQNLNAAYIVVTTPSGKQWTMPTYKSVQYTVEEDGENFVHVKLAEGARYHCEARYTPEEKGDYTYIVYNKDGEELASSYFDSFEMPFYPLKGFVGVSENDPRYFAYSDGTSFVPVGVELAKPVMEICESKDADFFFDGHPARTRVLKSYRDMIWQMSDNGANLVRIKIGGTVFDARTEIPEEYDYRAFALIDKLLDYCREKHVKAILTFDCFRTMSGGKNYREDEVLYKKDRILGQRIYDAKKYVSVKRYVDDIIKDLRGYIYRYSDDPAVFAFELFDEMDKVEGLDAEDVCNYTEYVCRRLKKAMPRTMLINSMSAVNTEPKISMQHKLNSCKTSFNTVKRCFDTSAELEICKSGLQEMVRDAVNEFKEKTKPLLITSGALTPYTDTPSIYYRMDKNGIFVNDMAFTPFFAGASGPSVMMFGEEYIDSHNFWYMFKNFSELVNSVKIDRQHFKFEYYERKYYTMSVMKGRTTTLIYIRSNFDTLKRTICLSRRVITRRGIRIQNFGGTHARVYPLADELPMPRDIELKNNEFWIPPFAHGLFLRIR